MFAILNALDILLTWYVGFEHEVNPAAIALGLQGLIVAKVLLVLYFYVTVWLFRKLWPMIGLYYGRIMVGMYSVIVLWNIRSAMLWPR